MFKVGDKVRVLRHRSYVGLDMSDTSGLIGKIVTLTNEPCDLKCDDFQSFGTDAEEWIVRSDDIEPVATGPVREVTRREIVPGTYGRVIVDRVLSKEVVVTIDDWHQPMTAEELDNVAMIASQLAEALRDV